jgi:hypothetical protein
MTNETCILLAVSGYYVRLHSHNCGWERPLELERRDYKLASFWECD